MPTPTDNPPPTAAEPPAADDLAQIIDAYNQVTEKLQISHERLQDEVVRLRTELASTNAQLQRSKRLSALGEMAAGIAHEIRNPLGAIQLYISMIVEDLQASAPELDVPLDNARKIAAGVRGLNGIVTDVLTFAGEIQPEPRLLRVADVFTRVIEAHRPAIEAAGVTVEMDGVEGAATIWADAQLLHQAVLNLVRNAVEAMRGRDGPRVLTLDVENDALSDEPRPSGSASPQNEPQPSGSDCSGIPRDGHALPHGCGSSDAGGITLIVRDTGPGLDQNDIDRIFNPFFTTRNTGTGLGLAIVHRIADAHHGSITADHHQGAIFRITLPAPPPAPSPPQQNHV